MTKFIGRKLNVGIGKEDTRGVGVAPTYWLNPLSFNHSDKANTFRNEGIFGGIWGGDSAYILQKWAEGEMEAELGDKSFGLILLALFGTVSSAVEETTAYKHTFSLQNDNQHDSLSLVAKDPDRDLLFELSMIESLSMEIVPDGLVTYTVSFRSKPSADSSNTASYTMENKFLGRHLAIKIAAATGNLDAASKICVQRLSLTVTKNLQDIYCLGTVHPSDIVNKMFSISGEIELLYESDTYKDYMLDGSTKALRLDLVNSDATVGATSNPSFRLDLSKVDFEAWDANYALDDIVNQTIQFNALYDFTNENLINDCYLINEATSY